MRLRSPWIYRAPAIAWGFFILYGSLAPSDSISTPIHVSDKLVHFIMYFNWVVFLYFGSSRAYTRLLTKRKLLLYWLSAISLGVLMEYMQKYMGLGRHADVMDALANTLGALTGVFASRLGHKFLERFLGSH